MEYKTPKVLEKKPVIGRFDLKAVMVIAICTLGAVFTLFASPLLSIGFIGICVVYLRIDKKYPQQGELNRLLKYQSSTKCVRINQQIKTLIKTK